MKDVEVDDYEEDCVTEFCEEELNVTKWDEVLELVESLKEDAHKTYVKKNKAAGLRLRKGLMSLSRLAKVCKSETIEMFKKQ